MSKNAMAWHPHQYELANIMIQWSQLHQRQLFDRVAEDEVLLRQGKPGIVTFSDIDSRPRDASGHFSKHQLYKHVLVSKTLSHPVFKNISWKENSLSYLLGKILSSCKSFLRERSTRYEKWWQYLPSMARENLIVLNVFTVRISAVSQIGNSLSFKKSY